MLLICGSLKDDVTAHAEQLAELGKRVCDSLVGFTLSCRHNQPRIGSSCLTNALMYVCFLSACIMPCYSPAFVVVYVVR